MLQITLGATEKLPIKAYFVCEDRSFPNGGSEAENQLAYAEKYEAFRGELGTVSAVRNYETGDAALFVGLGTAGKTDAEVMRRACAKLVEYANRQKLESLGLILPDAGAELLRAVAESAIMASYQYTEFLTSKKENPLTSVVISADKTLVTALNEGIALGEATCIARDLVNEPANSQTPQQLAKEACELGKRYGFQVEILEEAKILSLHMEAFHAVGRASPNRPVLIIMRYFGDSHHKEDITGLIGKGVTYDSGGLNLKTGARFITMKHDMAGSGTVIGSMCAIAQQKLSANVVAVVAACENVISGDAYKPGDIIGSMAGKTIQINSTDAEGRLTLIDAIHYAITHESVTRLVDIATLTGAARRILGAYGAPVLSNDTPLWDTLSRGAADAGELVCRVPLVEDARKKLRCDVADYVNTSLAEEGGMITAALFIEEFVQHKPWVHIDAAGPCWLSEERPFSPKGGSGWGTRTIYHMIKHLASQSVG